MISVVLLLGGNQGDVAQTFVGVKADLELKVGRIERCSAQFRSEAWGFSAAEFLNEAVVVSTLLDAEALLDATQSIEQKWGRSREDEAEEKAVSGERYCSRKIDIDIIFYGDQIIKTPRLVVPHPLMAERKFVLEPIAQIAPLMLHPENGKSVEQMLNDLNDL